MYNRGGNWINWVGFGFEFRFGFRRVRSDQFDIFEEIKSDQGRY
jgi:hypothetical protein